MKNNQYCKNCGKQQKRKIGFWEFCLGAVTASAAVKITKTIVKAYQSKPIDIDAKASVKPIDFAIYSSKSLKDIIVCRRKIAELMDLYEAATLDEILDIMGVDIVEGSNEEVLAHKVFNKDCKFRVAFRDGKYTLYGQAPVEVYDDGFREEAESKSDVQQSDVEE